MLFLFLETVNGSFVKRFQKPNEPNVEIRITVKKTQPLYVTGDSAVRWEPRKSLMSAPDLAFKPRGKRCELNNTE